MLRAKTHFDQIPLETVRKIVEEQAVGGIPAKNDPVNGKKKLEKDLSPAQKQSTVNSRTSSQVELSK